MADETTMARKNARVPIKIGACVPDCWLAQARPAPKMMTKIKAANDLFCFMINCLWEIVLALKILTGGDPTSPGWCGSESLWLGRFLPQNRGRSRQIYRSSEPF